MLKYFEEQIQHKEVPYVTDKMILAVVELFDQDSSIVVQLDRQLACDKLKDWSKKLKADFKSKNPHLFASQSGSVMQGIVDAVNGLSCMMSGKCGLQRASAPRARRGVHQCRHSTILILLGRYVLY